MESSPRWKRWTRATIRSVSYARGTYPPYIPRGPRFEGKKKEKERNGNGVIDESFRSNLKYLRRFLFFPFFFILYLHFFFFFRKEIFVSEPIKTIPR